LKVSNFLSQLIFQSLVSIAKGLDPSQKQPLETKKGKRRAFCSGSYNSNLGFQSVDQTGVTDFDDLDDFADLALQDLIHVMYL